MQPKYDPVLGALVDPSVSGIGFDAMLGRMSGGNGSGIIYDPFGGRMKTAFAQGPIPPSGPTREGLVAEFLFDGNMANTATVGYDGAAAGSGLEFRQSPSTRYSQHLRFTYGGYVSAPHDPAMDFGTGDFSVSAWIRMNGTNQCVMSRMSNGDWGDAVAGWNVVIGTGSGGPNGIEFNTWDPSGASSVWYANPTPAVYTSLSLNRALAYYTFERQGGTMRIYKNNVLVATNSSLPVRNVNTTRGMEFGRYNWAPNSLPLYFAGNMFAYRAFNRILTDSERNVWYEYENGALKPGGINKVCWHDDPYLVAYWPLTDGNLVDVKGGKTMQLFGASFIPGKGLFSGSPTDFVTPGYVNSSNYANCPTELGINGSANVMVSVLAKVYPSQNPSMLVGERSSAVNVSNGIRIDGGTSATGYRLRDYIQWQTGRTIGIPTSSTGPVDNGVWVHIMMRQVWGQWMETFVNFNSGGGGVASGNTGTGNPDGYRNGVTLFGRVYDPSPYSSLLGLVEAGTALVKDVTFWSNYQPYDDSDWVDRIASAYPEVYT